MGGLFAGGMPALRKTKNSPSSAPVSAGSKSPPGQSVGK